MSIISKCADQALKLQRQGLPRWKAVRIASEQGFTAERVILKELSRRERITREVSQNVAPHLDPELADFLEKRERQRHLGFALAHHTQLNRGFAIAGRDPDD
jgi:hypothetical protein